MTKLARVTKNIFQVGVMFASFILGLCFLVTISSCGGAKTTINGDGNTIINADSGAAGTTSVSVAPSMPLDHYFFALNSCSQGGCHESYDRHQGVEGVDIQACDSCHEPTP